jgi:hypothetical protein
MDGNIILTRTELEQMLAKAAAQGARAALREIGLADEHAGADVRQLRDLLSAWRQVRKGALQQLGRLLIGGLLLGLMFLAGKHSPF